MIAQTASLNQIRQLFLDDTPFLDVRAEIEFEKGTFPTSHNLPILTTEEREQVGLAYQEQGHDEAVALGHELVHGEVRETRINAWREFISENDDAYLYCWRGGMRSALAREWLKDTGVEIPLIRGGYKALRSTLLDELDSLVLGRPIPGGWRGDRYRQDDAGQQRGDRGRPGGSCQPSGIRIRPPRLGAAFSGKF